MKRIKIFLKKKKIKDEKQLKKDIKILLMKKIEKRLLYYLERKKKLTDYKANYYLAHTK